MIELLLVDSFILVVESERLLEGGEAPRLMVSVPKIADVEPLILFDKTCELPEPEPSDVDPELELGEGVAGCC